ncbi:MAG: hypothetical protein LUE86_02010 [Clostridiales bacterium]|nr:hypothetical protein [Clostridiales bacterium]
MCLWCVKRRSGKREWREVVMRAILLSFFFTYIIAILFSTLLIRTPAVEPKAAWIPLWSWYEVIANHRKSLFYEIVEYSAAVKPLFRKTGNRSFRRNWMSKD